MGEQSAFSKESNRVINRQVPQLRDPMGLMCLGACHKFKALSSFSGIKYSSHVKSASLSLKLISFKDKKKKDRIPGNPHL